MAVLGLSLHKKSERFASNVNGTSSLEISGTVLGRATNFKYLESTVASDSWLPKLTHAWAWRGSNCDFAFYRTMLERLKSKTYGAVVRAVAMCGAEC